MKCKKLISLILTLVMLLSIGNISVYAGTYGTGGSSTGSGGGGTKGDWLMGPDASAGLDWSKVREKGNSGWSDTWKTNVTKATYWGDIDTYKFPNNVVKWCAVIKYCSKVKYKTNSTFYSVNREDSNYNPKFFLWHWWYNCNLPNPADMVDSDEFRYYSAALKDSWPNCFKTLSNKSKKPTIWINGPYLYDKNLVDEAVKDGYSFNNSYDLYTNSSGKKLDIVWAEQQYVPKTKSVKTFVYLNKDADNCTAEESGGFWYPNNYDNNKYLFEHPITNDQSYYGKSGVDDTAYTKWIKSRVSTITKTYEVKVDANGNEISGTERNVNYSRSNDVNYEKHIYYDVTSPSIEATYFMPYNLNRNGLATLEEVKADYPSFNADESKKLIMTVDNLQGITNGSALKTLNTNTPLKFTFKFEDSTGYVNHQFGIPGAAYGGFDIKTSNQWASYQKADGSYDAGVMDAAGVEGSQVKTGEFYWTGKSTHDIINSDITKNSYWSTNFQLKVGLNSDKATLSNSTNALSEKLGSSEKIIVPTHSTNDTYYFKTATMGTYKLSSDSAGKDWLTVKYTGGKFYQYGIEFKGTVNINTGISNPTKMSQNFYTKMVSKDIVQPILKGTFEAKTVGQDYKTNN